MTASNASRSRRAERSRRMHVVQREHLRAPAREQARAERLEPEPLPVAHVGGARVAAVAQHAGHVLGCLERPPQRRGGAPPSACRPCRTGCAPRSRPARARGRARSARSRAPPAPRGAPAQRRARGRRAGRRPRDRRAGLASADDFFTGALRLGSRLHVPATGSGGVRRAGGGDHRRLLRDAAAEERVPARDPLRDQAGPLLAQRRRLPRRDARRLRPLRARRGDLLGRGRGGQRGAPDRGPGDARRRRQAPLHLGRPGRRRQPRAGRHLPHARRATRREPRDRLVQGDRRRHAAAERAARERGAVGDRTRRRRGRSRA